jgi:hypothetical protein
MLARGIELFTSNVSHCAKRTRGVVQWLPFESLFIRSLLKQTSSNPNNYSQTTPTVSPKTKHQLPHLPRSLYRAATTRNLDPFTWNTQLFRCNVAKSGHRNSITPPPKGSKCVTTPIPEMNNPQVYCKQFAVKDLIFPRIRAIFDCSLN